jgi:hypothetical protein
MATGFDRYAPVLLRAETSWKKLLMTALRKNYPNHHASTPKVALLHRDKIRDCQAGAKFSSALLTLLEIPQELSQPQM